MSPRQGDLGEVLDDRARAAYRQRLADLDERIAEAEADGDADAAARATEEREFLVAELTGAYGLGGPPPAGRRPGRARPDDRHLAHPRRPRPHRDRAPGPRQAPAGLGAHGSVLRLRAGAPGGVGGRGSHIVRWDPTPEE